MKNLFNINKEIGEIKNNYEDQGGTPYISISDSSNMQVESSHFSLNNKNSLSCINNQQNLANQNNNNNLILSNNGSLSLSKSIINNNINISHNNNNNSGIQVSFENVSLSGSNKLQISSNSIIFKKNDISKNSIFLSPSTLCNYYQQSNDVTPYKSPLIKQAEHEHELIHENDQSSGKEMHKLKQINIDILHKRKSVGGSNNKSMNKNMNNNNSNINNNNNGEITSRSEECEPSLDNNKTLSSQRKYVFDKKTPIKYAKNQLKSGEKNKSSKSNNSKLENNNSNSNISDNKTNHLEEQKNKKSKGITVIQNKNGRNLMDTFEKVGNGKENDDNLKFFNNRRQPTEIHLTSEEFKMNVNNNFDMNDGNNNFNKKFIDRLDDDSSFNEKDSKLNNDNEDINFLDKIKNNLKKEKNEEKNNLNENYNFKVEKIEKKKDDSINKENKENKENIIINNNKEGKQKSSIPIKKEDIKKICIKKILPIKKENNNITELSKNIIKELSRANLSKRKESRTKSRPSSFTKNIIINFNSFNSIGVNNNNIDNNIGFKSKKKSNILVKKNKYINEFRNEIKNTNEIFERKPTKMKLISKETKQNNNTIEPLQIRRKIKIPNRLGKKEKNTKETSISNITNNITNNIRERKRPPSSENYNRRATSFSNLKQTMNSNLFHNNNNNNNNNNKIVIKKNSSSNNSSGQKNINKNQFKKQKPLIVNLFVEEDSRHNQKNINVQISHHNNNNNNKNNQQDISHKVVRKKMKPLLTKKELANVNANSNCNSIINNVKYISNATTNNNGCINDRNYQTVSSVSRNVLDIKLRHKLNEKKENEDNLKKKDINKDNKSPSFYNNNINNINYDSNINNNMPIKKKEDPKVKIIQNFSSYHKIKYKSHIPEKINFAETQPKQMGIGGEGFYNSNKNNIPIKENKKQNNNSCQYGGNNLQNYNNKNNIIKQVKFRKLEKLPGDSDSGDVVLNDDCI